MPTIDLSQKEQKLRLLLLDVARSIDASGHAPEPVVLRWAGGWVRDKLLGIESHDIDVAINAMTGVSFAQRMCDYCDTSEAITNHQIDKTDIGNLHNVARNPDKSKHLETAMVRMFGLDLDFVNLRKETYTDQSRNPKVEFGTAEEDALRRDATINALFYNLNTNEIEDYTGGVLDIKAKIIRTPLEPLQTFTDDPLRVLRLVRFASRLEFAIDPNTELFMGDKKVLESLKVKISRERVGIELEKMLKGREGLSRRTSRHCLPKLPGHNPRLALNLIDRLDLYRAIFADPCKAAPNLPLLSRWSVAYKCLDELTRNKTPKSIFDLLVRTEDAAYVAWNQAALCPWMGIDDQPGLKRKSNAWPPVAAIAREGFKAPNKLVDIIAASYWHREEITALKKAVNDGEPHIRERDRVGMAIRRWDAQGGSWKLQVMNALLVEAMETLQAWEEPQVSNKSSPKEPLGIVLEEQQRFLQGWQNFLDHLIELDVFDAPSLKRLLDGRALARALGTNPGKWTGQALDICMEWQLRNPGNTDPAGAIEEVRKRRNEFGIQIS